MLFLAVLRTLFFHVDVKVILSYSKKKKKKTFLNSYRNFYIHWLFIFGESCHFFIGASLIAQLVKNVGDPSLIPGSGWSAEGIGYSTPVFLGFPCGSAGKEFSCNMGDLSSVPGLGRSSGEGKDYPLQYSGLENSMDCIVHGVTKSHFYVSIPIQDLICLIFVQILFQSVDKILQFSSYGHVPFH